MRQWWDLDQLEGLYGQFLDANGPLLRRWCPDPAGPSDLAGQRDPAGERAYVGELGPGLPVSQGIPHLGARVGIYTLDNRLLARLGDPLPGTEPRQFLAPHCVAVDSSGDVYVGEVSWMEHGRHLTPPQEVRSFRKLVRMAQ